ncbi:MarR family winged helix-turn-helix transcriptional regulator [Edaphobacillus lindanitolerans]|uniref:DNA-binding transcriptional regulator, MarR family n=1 Tax=Edaphobacillus lindanitolerans TaxID=550447 RepID=A0A1U7PN19_9BACI|nr:MarR family transcriptional regulator [Edaphobacillus lindanitolerans]SIT72054.1 DNA-binding transcriptional regulator, MarR family [Edaphobacillus lindanitolerans]
MESHVEEIKHFNRFYTNVMGILNLYNDEVNYSATEAMVLYKIKNTEDCTAAYLSESFGMDKGYISRILKRFEKDQLIDKTPSEQDRRLLYIKLTKEGGEVLDYLAGRASDRVRDLISDCPEEDVEELIGSMKRIEQILRPTITKGGN